MKSEKRLSMLAGWRGKLLSLTSCVLLWAGCGPAVEQSAAGVDDQQGQGSAEDHSEHEQEASAITITTPNDNAYSIGQFSAVRNWPIIPIATMVQPDGKVFAYGTTGMPNPKQGADVIYTVWDPVRDTFNTKPNGAHSDVFCSGQALIPGSGDTLMVGGDTSLNGIINNGLTDVNILNFDGGIGGTIEAQTKTTTYSRWYPTLVTLPNGEHLILGGLSTQKATVPGETIADIPEIRNANTGVWRQLGDAQSAEAYGEVRDAWSYPRAWVNPRGSVFIVNNAGHMFDLETTGKGKVTKFMNPLNPNLPLLSKDGYSTLTAIMFEPGRIFTARNGAEGKIIDINNDLPHVTSAGNAKYLRKYGNSTVMADGRIFLNGGSTEGNVLGGDIFESEMYDPKANSWKIMATATRRRLYHSTSMLLPDGRVFTGGGGAPGPNPTPAQPNNEVNSEIYFPPYLFKQVNGTSVLVTDRPKITAALGKLNWNQAFNVTSTKKIKRVTLVRIGGTTHNYNNETRFYTLGEWLIAAEQQTTVSVVSPQNSFVAPPGFYMLFVFDPTGVPSVAKIIRIDNLPN